MSESKEPLPVIVQVVPEAVYTKPWRSLRNVALFHIAPCGVAILMGVITIYQTGPSGPVINFNTASPISLGSLGLFSATLAFIETVYQLRRYGGPDKATPVMWIHCIVEIVCIFLCLWFAILNSSGVCISETAVFEKCYEDNRTGIILAGIDYVSGLGVCVTCLVCLVIKIYYRRQLGLLVGDPEIKEMRKLLEISLYGRHGAML